MCSAKDEGDSNQRQATNVFRREMVTFKKLVLSNGYDAHIVVGLALLPASFILGPPIIGYLQSYWTFCGDCSQNAWNAFVDRIGEDPSKYYFWATVLLPAAAYWLFGGLLTVADFTLSQSALRQYKMQPEAKESLAPRRLVKVVLVVLFNQVVVGALVGHVLYVGMDWRGFPPIRELPSLARVVMSLALFVLVEEVGVFYLHRLFHARAIYRHIHKLHHEWKAPIALAAVYQHPLETFVYVLPAIIGMVLMRAHPFTLWLTSVFLTLGSLREHSGYLLPMLGSPAHDYHHTTPTECFGVLGLMDRLHGTNTTFLSSRHGVKHEELTRADMKQESLTSSVKED